MVYYDISKKESSKNDNLFVISDNFMIHMYKYSKYLFWLCYQKMISCVFDLFCTVLGCIAVGFDCTRSNYVVLYWAV